MDALHEIFTAREMRTKQENPSTKEASFKASKRTKKKKNHDSKTNCSCSDDSYEDEEMANFMRKLKKGTDKYNDMFPLKCFNCGKIGHFANKCHYAKKSDSDEEEYSKKENKYQKGNRKDKRKVFNKNLYSREESFLSGEDNKSDGNSERVLFMATKNKKSTKKVKWILR
jgi:hypothetical protein